MSTKRRGGQKSGSDGLRRAGRPSLHGREAQIELVRYVLDQQRRTGLPINKVLKYGVFVQAMSGSPGPDGPDRATVLHVLRGAALRRRYFEAQALLKRYADSHD